MDNLDNVHKSQTQMEALLHCGSASGTTHMGAAVVLSRQPRTFLLHPPEGTLYWIWRLSFCGYTRYTHALYIKRMVTNTKHVVLIVPIRVSSEPWWSA